MNALRDVIFIRQKDWSKTIGVSCKHLRLAVRRRTGSCLCPSGLLSVKWRRSLAGGLLETKFTGCQFSEPTQTARCVTKKVLQVSLYFLLLVIFQLKRVVMFSFCQKTESDAWRRNFTDWRKLNIKRNMWSFLMQLLSICPHLVLFAVLTL